MNYFFYILLGVLPSLVWLSFYLRKDSHPEPKRTVLKIFFLGMIAPFFALPLEILFREVIFKIDLSMAFLQIIYIFLGIALVEELLKYFTVKNRLVIFKNGIIEESQFDEPLDLMLYMIIAALGFAATENILKFFSKGLPVFETFLISSLRFVGATFLHALCSGLFGFFLALSFFEMKKKRRFLALGLILAVLLHGAFNYSIIKIDESLAINRGKAEIINFEMFLVFSALLVIILTGLALFVSFGFKKLTKLASICKINS